MLLKAPKAQAQVRSFECPLFLDSTKASTVPQILLYLLCTAYSLVS